MKKKKKKKKVLPLYILHNLETNAVYTLYEFHPVPEQLAEIRYVGGPDWQVFKKKQIHKTF